MFELKVTLQKILKIKFEELEIVSSNKRGDRIGDVSVVNKIIDRFRFFILQQINVKITKKKNFL